MRNRSRARGFTLIEALVALALLSLLATGLFTTFSVGQRTYAQVVRGAEEHASVTVAQRFLRRTIETAYPFDPSSRADVTLAGLQGDAARLLATAPMPRADGSAGYYRYELLLVPRTNGSFDLLVRSGLDRNGAFAAAAREEVLLSRIAGAEWAYFEAGRVPRWRSEWSDKRPPQLVRLRIRFAPGDPREWPDLIVAPRITDDANCEFDVVSQACRERSS